MALMTCEAAMIQAQPKLHDCQIAQPAMLELDVTAVVQLSQKSIRSDDRQMYTLRGQ